MMVSFSGASNHRSNNGSFPFDIRPIIGIILILSGVMGIIYFSIYPGCSSGSIIDFHGNCVQCAPGSRSNGKQTECILCEAGSYQPYPGRTHCFECNSKNYNGTGANSVTYTSTNYFLSETLCQLITEPTKVPTSSASPSPSPNHARRVMLNDKSKQERGIEPSSSFFIPEDTAPSYSDASWQNSSPSISSMSQAHVSHNIFVHLNTNIPPSLEPSNLQSPFMSSTVATFFNSGVKDHDNCVDCHPKSSPWIFILYGIFVIMIGQLFRHVCPSFLFLCFDYLQTMGLLSIVRRVQLSIPLFSALRAVESWASLDWISLVHRTTTSHSRFFVVLMPLAIANIPIDVANLAVTLGCCFRSFHAADLWTNNFIMYWSNLVLLLTIQTTTLTIMETLRCDGKGLLCLRSDSFVDPLVANATLFLGAYHLCSLSYNLSLKDNDSDSITSQIFVHYLWSLEFVWRRWIMTLIALWFDGTMASILIVVWQVLRSFVAHLYMQPYRDNSHLHFIVHVILGLCLISLVILVHIPSHASTIFGMGIIGLAVGSCAVGIMVHVVFAWRQSRRPDMIRAVTTSHSCEDERLYHVESGQERDRS